MSQIISLELEDIQIKAFGCLYFWLVKVRNLTILAFFFSATLLYNVSSDYFLLIQDFKT